MKLIIVGKPLSTDETRKGNYIHKFLVGDKVVKIHSRENGLKPEENVQMAVNIPEDARFPMLFEKEEERKVLSK